MDTTETLYVITEGDEHPTQIILDVLSGEPHSWKGPYRDIKLAEAYCHQVIHRLYEDPKTGHYKIHAFNITDFRVHSQNIGPHISILNQAA